MKITNAIIGARITKIVESDDDLLEIHFDNKMILHCHGSLDIETTKQYKARYKKFRELSDKLDINNPKSAIKLMEFLANG